MKIIVIASQVIELEIPGNIDPEDVNDFVYDEIQEIYLPGSWDFLGWEKIKEKDAIS